MRKNWVLLCAGLAWACTPTDSQLRTRAAFDMQCPEQQLQIVHIDMEVRGVVGCGQQRTYVSMCNGQPGALSTTCNWVANGSSAMSPSYTAAAPAPNPTDPIGAPPPAPPAPSRTTEPRPQ